MKDEHKQYDENSAVRTAGQKYLGYNFRRSEMKSRTLGGHGHPHPERSCGALHQLQQKPGCSEHKVVEFFLFVLLFVC